MVAFAKEYAPKTEAPDAQNRVWEFFLATPETRRVDRRPARHTHREKADTATKTASGMSYYGFRFYSPGQGRFLNRDPIGEYGAIILREKESIVSEELALSIPFYKKEEINLYAFVENNPINHFDYLGLSLWGCTPGPECCKGQYSCYSTGPGVKLRSGRIWCNYDCQLMGGDSVSGPEGCSRDDFPPTLGGVEEVFSGMDECPLLHYVERKFVDRKPCN